MCLNELIVDKGHKNPFIRGEKKPKQQLAVFTQSGSFKEKYKISQKRIWNHIGSTGDQNVINKITDSTGILVLRYFQLPPSSQTASPQPTGSISFRSCCFPYQPSICPPLLLLYSHPLLLLPGGLTNTVLSTLQTVVKLLMSCEDCCSYFGSTEQLACLKTCIPSHPLILYYFA